MKTKPSLNTIFYIVPHADDWQLFMNPETFKDVNCPQTKIIFIITTAGDAGMGKKYWRAREEGMKASILYCFKPGEEKKISQGSKMVGDGRIYYWSVNNVRSYFLRLPDGGIVGEGFAKNNYENLQKLENGTIESLSGLDGNLLLKSWSDFITLLSTIIWGEINTDKEKICVKLLDPDSKSNPSDHADHQSTGRAILALNNLPVSTKILFKGYGSNCAKMLTQEEIFWKAGIFAVYENVVFKKTGYSTLSENINLYKKWILASPEFIVIDEN